MKDFITAVGNIYADKDRPGWAFESPPKQQELIRYQGRKVKNKNEIFSVGGASNRIMYIVLLISQKDYMPL